MILINVEAHIFFVFSFIMGNDDNESSAASEYFHLKAGNYAKHHWKFKYAIDLHIFCSVKIYPDTHAKCFKRHFYLVPKISISCQIIILNSFSKKSGS